MTFAELSPSEKTEILKRIEALELELQGLKTYVMGDAVLEVPSLRDDIKAVKAEIKAVGDSANEKLAVMDERWKRIVWTAAGLGLSNAGVIVTYLSQIIGK